MLIKSRLIIQVRYYTRAKMRLVLSCVELRKMRNDFS